MALPDLAAVADLNARGVEPDDDDVAEVFLGVASSVVRAAAGSPIARATSTVEVWAQDADRYLDLPGQPVTAVSSVAIDGNVLGAGDYKLVNGRLWRWCGWAFDPNGFEDCVPVPVTVTMTHGVPIVPAWVVQLVCDLAIAGMKAAPNGARDPRIFVESLGPYSVTYSQAGALVATAMELPNATKQALRTAFGGGVGAVAFR